MYWQLGAPLFTSWFGKYEPHPRHFKVGMQEAMMRRGKPVFYYYIFHDLLKYCIPG